MVIVYLVVLDGYVIVAPAWRTPGGPNKGADIDAVPVIMDIVVMDADVAYRREISVRGVRPPFYTSIILG